MVQEGGNSNLVKVVLNDYWEVYSTKATGRKYAENMEIQRTWIGVSDAEVEGEWRNYYGQLQTYLPWSSTEPSNGSNEKYCSLLDHGKWSDSTDKQSFETLCTHVRRGTSP